MTIENWAKGPGLPPIKVDVLWRKDLSCRDLHEEIVLVRGERPHGIKHKGSTGNETILFRRKQEDESWRIFEPLQPEMYIKEIPFKIRNNN